MKSKGILLLLPFLVACGAGEAGESEGQQALRIETNEALAVSHLRSLVGAQIQAQSLLAIDADQDGTGEFAFVSELGGARKARGPGGGMKLPLLSGGFDTISPTGFVEVHGYLYRAYLPGPGGTPVGEGPEEAGAEVQADGAERSWLCYAWPASYGETGRRTFVVGLTGKIHAADLAELSGAEGPEAGRALVTGAGLGGDFRADWEAVD